MKPWEDPTCEWLETDGLGGFASGTACGIRTRRYHALLLAAARPPADRFVLVNGLETWVRTRQGEYALSSQRYAPDVVHPDGARRIAEFRHEPWPAWRFELEDGTIVAHELLCRHGRPLVLAIWRIERAAGPVELCVRPLLSGRDPHQLHHENPSLRFDFERAGEDAIRWQPYIGLPSILARTTGKYEHRPDWYRSFLYEEERQRGLDHVEDLASPGVLRFALASGEEAFLSLEAEGVAPAASTAAGSIGAWGPALRQAEGERRARFASPLERAADSYIVRRGSGLTVVAGYPWFGDWGRDTFIALRGLCLAGGRVEDAGRMLEEWVGFVSEGMIPNRLPDRGETPEYNAVDASLWYAVAAAEYLEAAGDGRSRVASRRASRLCEAVDAILEGYSRGTRHGIRADSDGLLSAGETGVQLTWMDAKVGDWVVTPRVGKPVEVQALWLNALAAAADWNPRFAAALRLGLASFGERFWDEGRGCLHDVVDVDHVPGTADPTLRPNQILAVGGLPLPLLEGRRARSVVDAVERRLLTPLGLRSLDPAHPAYTPRYEGGVRERDGAYHQGTVWPWLLGPFVEAWVRVRGGDARTRREARGRFLAPLAEHLGRAGLGHVSEIADAEPPHAPRGCPFQAWSVGEYLRLEREVLAPAEAARKAPGRHAPRGSITRRAPETTT